MLIEAGNEVVGLDSDLRNEGAAFTMSARL
jgi:hypothetical protein